MIQDRLEVFYLLTSHLYLLSEEIDHCAFHMLHKRDKSICVAALQARQALLVRLFNLFPEALQISKDYANLV
jgi:hypothetical protein